jgi:hypothetical protein
MKKNRTANFSRRQFIGGAAATVALSTASVSADLGRRQLLQVQGFVRDVDHSHHGLPRVMISNGRDIVVTDEAGRYEISASTDDFVSIIKPSGWQPVVGSPHNRICTLLAKEASEAVRPATPGYHLPTLTIDFDLRSVSEPNCFRVALIADTQPSNLMELGFLQDAILRDVAKCGAAFGIHHGDVVGDDLSLLAPCLSLLSATNMTWHYCPGNHDMNAKAPEQAFDTWRHVVGPTHQAFNYGRATFILLNNVAPLKASRQRYEGTIGPSQLAFVRGILHNTPRDNLIVVSMHIPLINYETPNSSSDTTSDCAALLELLSPFEHTVSFSGHQHTTEHHYLGAASGWSRSAPHHHHVLNAACGSWWCGPKDESGLPVAHSRDGCPKGFHILEVDGHRYTTRFVSPANTQSRMRASIICRSTDDFASDWSVHHSFEQAALANARLIVSVFDGGPRTKVSLQFAGASAQVVPAEPATMADPAYVNLFAESPHKFPAWARPVLSSHIWQGPIPLDLPTGAHRVEIHIQDEYGQNEIGTLMFAIEPQS